MFFFFWFFGSSSSSSASVQRRPLLCRGEALGLAALAGWASCGFFCRVLPLERTALLFGSR